MRQQGARSIGAVPKVHPGAGTHGVGHVDIGSDKQRQTEAKTERVRESRGEDSSSVGGMNG